MQEVCHAWSGSRGMLRWVCSGQNGGLSLCAAVGGNRDDADVIWSVHPVYT